MSIICSVLCFKLLFDVVEVVQRPLNIKFKMNVDLGAFVVLTHRVFVFVTNWIVGFNLLFRINLLPSSASSVKSAQPGRCDASN